MTLRLIHSNFLSPAVWTLFPPAWEPALEISHKWTSQGMLLIHFTSFHMFRFDLKNYLVCNNYSINGTNEQSKLWILNLDVLQYQECGKRRIQSRWGKNKNRIGQFNNIKYFKHYSTLNFYTEFIIRLLKIKLNDYYLMTLQSSILHIYLIHTCSLIWRLQLEAEAPQYTDVIHQIKWVDPNFTTE